MLRPNTWVPSRVWAQGTPVKSGFEVVLSRTTGHRLAPTYPQPSLEGQTHVTPRPVPEMGPLGKQNKTKPKPHRPLLPVGDACGHLAFKVSDFAFHVTAFCFPEIIAVTDGRAAHLLGARMKQPTSLLYL